MDCGLVCPEFRGVLQGGRCARGLPCRGSFVHMRRVCGSRMRARCVRVGPVDGPRKDWFFFFANKLANVFLI